MKKYRLLKDLPGIPAGTESEDLNYHGNPMWSHDGHLYIISKTNREWVQEIPDYSFVRDGDIYKTADSYWEFLMVKGGRSSLATHAKASRLDYNFFGSSKIEEHSDRRCLKPENLVYRPGKNPWDTPLVDKLGWGPMEPRKQELNVKTSMYSIEPSINRKPGCGYTVWKNDTTKTWVGTMDTLRDAELFKKALEGT